MAEDGAVQYEHQSVKVIRGREASKVAEMQNQGWEMVSQTQGTLRTEMTFRRVKKRFSYAPWMGGVALGMLIALFLAFNTLGDDDDPEPNDPPAAAATEQTDEPTDEPTPPPTEEPSEETTGTTTEEPTPSPTEEPAEEPTEEPTEADPGAPPGDAVLTIQNSPDLKALLTADDDYSLNRSFAKTHQGRKIQFDGSVADATPGYFLVYFGNDSDTNATSGPAFQFRVRTLQVGGRPAATGDNLRFVATVGAFNVDQGLFFLTPVKVTER